MLTARMLVLVSGITLLLVLSAEAVQLIAKMALVGVLSTVMITGSMMAAEMVQALIGNFTSIYTRFG